MANSKMYSDDLMRWIFAGMRRDEGQEIYFNHSTMDVQQLTDGYLASIMVPDQSTENRRLLNRIQSGDDSDEIIEDVHYLLPRIKVSDYLGIFLNLAEGNELFVRITKEFYTELVKNRSHIVYVNDNLYVEFIRKIEANCKGDENKMREFGGYLKQAQKFFGYCFLEEEVGVNLKETNASPNMDKLLSKCPLDKNDLDHFLQKFTAMRDTISAITLREMNVQMPDRSLSDLCQIFFYVAINIESTLEDKYQGGVQLIKQSLGKQLEIFKTELRNIARASIARGVPKDLILQYLSLYYQVTHEKLFPHQPIILRQR